MKISTSKLSIEESLLRFAYRGRRIVWGGVEMAGPGNAGLFNFLRRIAQGRVQGVRVTRLQLENVSDTSVTLVVTIVRRQGEDDRIYAREVGLKKAKTIQRYFRTQLRS